MRKNKFAEKIRTLLKNKRALRIILAAVTVVAVCFSVLIIGLVTGESGDNKEKFTVVFSTSGGGFIPSQKLSAGEKITEPEPPEKDGFVFGGWRFHGSEWNFNTDTVKSSVILDAVWHEAVTVYFDDGASVQETKIAKGRPIRSSDIPSGVASGVFAWFEGGQRRNLSLPVNEDLYLVAGYNAALRVSAETEAIINALCPNAESLLGITLVRSDSECDLSLAPIDTEDTNVLKLVEYMLYLPHLKAFITEHSELLSGIADLEALSSSPIPAKKYSFYARAEWMSTLLDGALEGGSSLIPSVYCRPLITADRVSAQRSDGTGSVEKRLGLSDNIVNLLNQYGYEGGISAYDASRTLLTYINQAYTGYYGSRASELFLGGKSAYDTDELTALLRIAVACSDVFGCDSVGGIYVECDTAAASSLMSVLFGIEHIESELPLLSLSDNRLDYCGTDALVTDGAARFNQMIFEGLITFDNSDSAIMRYTAENCGVPPEYEEISSPVSLLTSDADGNAELSRIKEPLAFDTTVAASLSESLISSDKSKLLAALRLIDYLYV